MKVFVLMVILMGNSTGDYEANDLFRFEGRCEAQGQHLLDMGEVIEYKCVEVKYGDKFKRPE